MLKHTPISTFFLLALVMRKNPSEDCAFHFFLSSCCILWLCAQSLSRVQLFVTPQTIARQAPLSMGFSRQGNQSGLPFPHPGGLPIPGFEAASPVSSVSPALSSRFFTTEPPGKHVGQHKSACVLMLLKNQASVLPSLQCTSILSLPCMHEVYHKNGEK